MIPSLLRAFTRPRATAVDRRTPLDAASHRGALCSSSVKASTPRSGLAACGCRPQAISPGNVCSHLPPAFQPPSSWSVTCSTLKAAANALQCSPCFVQSQAASSTVGSLASMMGFPASRLSMMPCSQPPGIAQGLLMQGSLGRVWT